MQHPFRPRHLDRHYHWLEPGSKLIWVDIVSRKCCNPPSASYIVNACPGDIREISDMLTVQTPACLKVTVSCDPGHEF